MFGIETADNAFAIALGMVSRIEGMGERIRGTYEIDAFDILNLQQDYNFVVLVKGYDW